MDGTIRMKSQAGSARPAPASVIWAVAGRPCVAVLDSADTGPGRGRFTVVAFDPVRCVSWGGGSEDPFEAMRAYLKASCGRLDWSDGVVEEAAGAFPCGWIGYFAYEAGRFIESLPACTVDDVGLPLARFALYDTVAIHDAVSGGWTLVAADLAEMAPGTRRPSSERRLAEWQGVLAQAEQSPPVLPASPPMAEPQHNMTRVQYERMVERAIEHIAAGDIFQVNLARRETFAVCERPVATYLRLRRTNPAAYAAFLAWDAGERTGRWNAGAAGECAILSSSPELFLRVRDGRILTRPIKGTRPRSSDDVVDAAYRLELAGSDKDRAELAMIVDLERNDLGRVCRYGSVSVVTPGESPAWPFALESHPTVHHLVADVVGELADGFDVIDLLRATFPGGSITGAPKVRAMELIDALEPTVRSVYTGAIGGVGLDGSAVFNIAIRTLIAAGQQMHLYTGGGIVADSRPEQEYEETVAKALGMRRAIQVARGAVDERCTARREPL